MTQTTSPAPIVLYSKTGHSRRVAEHLCNLIGAAPFEVTTRAYRWPLLGWISAGRDGMHGHAAVLDQSPDLPAAGLVILVGPVWAGGPAAPLNTVVDMLRGGAQDVAVLLTCGDPKEEGAPLEKIESRLGRPLRAGMVLSNPMQDTTEGAARIQSFVQGCVGTAPSG